MKKQLLLFIFFQLFIFNVKGQNLVPNGDFEQYSSCPSGFSQLDSALFWINPTVPSASGSSPDYFNQCATSSGVSVPGNNFGYQPAHSGNGYGGGIFWYGGPSPNYRENFETSLISPLTAGQCYYFEMYVALAEKSDHTTSSLGIYFSNTLVNGINNYLPLPFTPQIVNNIGFITDTMNWTLVSGNYTATGGESYLIIANFNDDANTPIQQTGFGIFPEAYFYIDDVSLTPCTGIEDQNQNEAIKIYPNPVGEELKVSGLKFKIGEKAEIIITDVSGKEILKSIFSNQHSTINVQSLKSGVYNLEIRDNENSWRKKFLKAY